MQNFVRRAFLYSLLQRFVLENPIDTFSLVSLFQFFCIVCQSGTQYSKKITGTGEGREERGRSCFVPGGDKTCTFLRNDVSNKKRVHKRNNILAQYFFNLSTFFS